VLDRKEERKKNVGFLSNCSVWPATATLGLLPSCRKACLADLHGRSCNGIAYDRVHIIGRKKLSGSN
jgi:hypothetical protein